MHKSFNRISSGAAAISSLLLILLVSSCNGDNAGIKKLSPVDFSDVDIHDAFWSPRLDKHKNVTLQVCIDQIENQTGRIRNFENAARREGAHSGIFFDDSDVYKALEGMAYSLALDRDEALEAKCDEWIDKIAAAQLEDGYINTFYTLTGLDGRWTDMEKHEMYCAGHMTEAAVAYYKATGKRKLLDAAIRMADHMMSIFGPGKRDWVPGHEEIELALVKLSDVTGEKKYLDFAYWLLEERGRGKVAYNADSHFDKAYFQDRVPVSRLTDIEGHAVRAMYLFCGMADVAAHTGDTGYIAALDRLWEDVVCRNMYITGGIGQSANNEGFAEDYFLPNKEAYCETCASVGMVLWNSRMLQFKEDAVYADVLEKAMYNGALAGISLSGDKFFYVNPLESDGTHHRLSWFGCACCPSQICRFLPSIGGYVYCTGDNSLWVNLYMGNSLDSKDAALEMKTAYPDDGSVSIVIERLKAKELRLRIPGWCKQWSISVNGEETTPPVEKGYAVLTRKWKKGDTVDLNLRMECEAVKADPRVKEDEGKVAVRRGPLVFCMEEVDNPDDFDSLKISPEATLEYSQGRITAGGITLIPYYAWDNRSAGRMKVWIPESL